MSITAGTIDGNGRKNLLRVFLQEAANQKSYLEQIVGNVLHTNQSFEQFKNLVGFGPMSQAADGEELPSDSPRNLYSKTFTPQIYGKVIPVTALNTFVEQYKQVMNYQKAMARSYTEKLNLVSADLLNLGFTNTTTGPNNEALFSLHNNNGYTFNNRGAGGAGVVTPVDLALSPTGVETMRQILSNQLTARGLPWIYDGGTLVIVPPNLWGASFVLEHTKKRAGTNANDTSFIDSTQGVRYEPNAYLTSNKAWFARADKNSDVYTFCLHQMPYNMIVGHSHKALITDYVGYCSFVMGFFTWINYWGTTGGI